MSENCRILVVEDEIFVAIEIEHVIQEMGYECVGIAADREAAMSFGTQANIALVDVNLRDGSTGVEIGRELAGRHDMTVLFMTANPTQLGDGVPGTLGVIGKPVADDELRASIRYAVAAYHRHNDAEPPSRLHLFMLPDGIGSQRGSSTN